jgi:signal transduction histidine kinase
MKLVARLWVLGALLPLAGMAALAVGSGWMLRAQLAGSLDRALLTQAAVESVSLFDGPEGEVHLHMETSPLEQEVRPFAPSAAIYRSDGSLLLSYPQAAATADERVAPRDVHAPPELSTAISKTGEHFRLVTSSLLGEDGHVYTLRISAALAPIEHTMMLYWRTTALSAAVFGLILVLVQGWQARRLTGRLATLSRHVEAVREGRLDEQLPLDATGDEIAGLRDMLAEATTRLREARASQERLVADAAHELRTPLTIMRTSVDLALRRTRDASELRGALEDVRREVDRLTILASHLLDLATQGQASLERVAGDLRPIVDEAIDAALPAAEVRNVSITSELPSAAVASIHAASVRQAVDNLLSNAIKYAPMGGEIHVAARRDGEHWVISVDDPGPGIPREHREAVFAPFHRVPGSLPGAGLGLAIVQEVAKRHGGRAYVGDVPSGTRVVLELAAA